MYEMEWMRWGISIMVVADGDGVIIIPREIARGVATWAHEEHERDKKDRREQYIKVGLEFDETL